MNMYYKIHQNILLGVKCIATVYQREVLIHVVIVGVVDFLCLILPSSGDRLYCKKVKSL